HAPNVEIMADISTLDEAQQADKLGFDYIGTTLRGYTSYTKGHILYENEFAFLKDVLNSVSAKVIAEGNVITPEMYKQVSD
ncbi:N-acetylmannosamine-6-phosphate 2-epimerase, partial [Staphylococcus pasteuri]